MGDIPLTCNYSGVSDDVGSEGHKFWINVVIMITRDPVLSGDIFHSNTLVTGYDDSQNQTHVYLLPILAIIESV